MMKKEKDELTDLFRSRLDNAMMSPREGFWEDIQDEVSLIEKKRRRIMIYRAVAAASVLLIIGMTSAMFYLLKPDTEAVQTLAKINTLMPQTAPNTPHKIEIEPQPIKAAVAQASMSASVAKGNSSSSTTKTALSKISKKTSLNNGEDVDSEDSTVTVTVHMTVRVRENGDYASNQQTGNNNVWQAGGLNNQENNNNNNETQDTYNKQLAQVSNVANTWALKASVGAAMPANNTFDAPLNASLTLEKNINKWFAIEAGLKYTYMNSKDQTLHYLSLPVKANITLAKTPKIDVYATGGGSIDKCIAATNQSANEKFQYSALAGLGIRYHFNNKLSVFAEPTMIHFFNNESKYTSYRTNKNNAFNLQSGLCMNF